MKFEVIIASVVDIFVVSQCEDPTEDNFEFSEDCCADREGGCNEGVGDCDGDEQCAGDLVCGADNCAALWPALGYPPESDCCVSQANAQRTNGTGNTWLTVWSSSFFSICHCTTLLVEVQQSAVRSMILSVSGSNEYINVSIELSLVTKTRNQVSDVRLKVFKDKMHANSRFQCNIRKF